tara:strand:- start:2402 stop:2677 length:276 start_codon:yes stop_codon:yes gene_type:complete
MEFEWDPSKARKNLQKHGISFSEAATVFGDSLSVTFSDPDHSVRENRYIITGLSSTGQVLLIAHTYRNNRIRIISARKATRQERKYYEEEK